MAKLIKRRIPPFAMGLVLGTLLSVFLFSYWQKNRPPGGLLGLGTPAHRELAESKLWLNAVRSPRAEELGGRWIALHFFTYSDVNAQRSWERLTRLAGEYGPGMALIGVHAAKFDGEKNPDSIRAAVERLGIRSLVIDDSDFRLWKAYAVHSWPTVVMLDAGGSVFATYAGDFSADELLAKMRENDKRYPLSPRVLPLPIAEESRLPEKVEAPARTSLRFPMKLAYGNDLLWVSDSGHNRILGIDTESGEVKQLIGSGQAGNADGEFSAAQFNAPAGIAFAKGKLWVADTRNHLVRVVDLAKRSVGTVAGTGSAARAKPEATAETGRAMVALETPLNFPTDLAVTKDGNTLWIAMQGANQIWTLDLLKGRASVGAGSGREALEDGPLPLNALAQPEALAEVGGSVYFVDGESSALRVLKKNGAVETLVGNEGFAFGNADGKAEQALLQHPTGIYLARGGEVLVVDTFNHSIRRFDRTRLTIKTILGKPGRGMLDGKIEEARFFEPTDIERVGSLYYVADSANHLIRVVDFNIGDVRTLTLK